MCTVLKVSRSGYYEWIRRKESRRCKRHERLKKQIRRAFYDSRRLYGSRKIWEVHSVLKKELVYLEKFKTRKEAKARIFEYISCFYNGKRIH
ncbi:IS3 family transposase [Paenibacillus sepulcri]|uniref:IS3 family transposase n=1 Tax=Paenibacillus sepulcri TaxID=359917 RepID=UPI0035E6EF97